MDEDMMDITPSAAFQQAFKNVVELDCTPLNVITVIREHPELYEEVQRELVRPPYPTKLNPPSRRQPWRWRR